ncbi:MAG: UPF0280 family protein [Syntrophobacterales bacterium]|nr:MAG: UPF0280 family protein [Syntrophobacterales bacterium]
MFEARTYRNLVKAKDLTSFRVTIRETDLFLLANCKLEKEAKEAIIGYRWQIEEYIRYNPKFRTSLTPVDNDPHAPKIVKEMLKSSRLASVGPMASVAGAIAEFVGKDLIPLSPEVICENGGDIFIASSKERVVGIYAGKSPLSLKVGLRIKPVDTPLGVCSSSGTVGHSMSFGKADAVCVLSRSASLADAAATSIGNLIEGKGDIKKGLDYGSQIRGIIGVLIIVGDTMGMRGGLELTNLSS